MLSRDTVELITITTSQNALGDDVENKSYNKVFANNMKIMSSEFYQAAATGIKPTLKLEVRTFEYSNQEKVRYPSTTGDEYTVIRTFPKNSEWIELTLEGLVI